MQESNGKYSISFQEMAERGKEILARQGTITYEKAKTQVDRLRKGSYLRTMGIMFGGWAREEEDKSPEEQAYDKGFSEGVKAGRTDGISKCLLLVSQSLDLKYEQKTKLWNELQKLL